MQLNALRNWAADKVASVIFILNLLFEVQLTGEG